MRSYWLLPKASRTDGTAWALRLNKIDVVTKRSGQAAPWGWHLMSYSLQGSPSYGPLKRSFHSDHQSLAESGQRERRKKTSAS